MERLAAKVVATRPGSSGQAVAARRHRPFSLVAPDATVVRAMRFEGRCTVLYVHDVGHRIDLEAAERRLGALRSRIPLRHMKRVAPSASEIDEPLRLTASEPPVELGSFRTAESVDAVLYEPGAVCVRFEIPLHATLEELAALSDRLYDHEPLARRARQRTARLLEALGDAVEQPQLGELVEDYALFRLTLPEGLAPEQLVADHGPVLARILRGEREALSGQEVEDALARRLSFSRDDMVLLDWYAAVLLGEELDDELAVIELAVVELLELRELDASLDEALSAAWRLLTRPARGPWGRLALPTRDLRRVAELQAESAMRFEGVSNAFKMLGDQYLARLYHTAAERFRLASWDAAIERKLQTLAHIHQVLAEGASSRRIEVLEWIVIVLIATEIGLGLAGLW